mgnify:CR=1 FL=1
MNGLVIEKGEKYFTFLKSIFLAIENVQKEYNWLITGHECYPQNTEYAKKLSEEYCWITGKELTKMIDDEDFQWIWGVFSAFPKSITKEEVLKSKLPYANGYTGLWKNPVSIQHPLAEIEIVAWDSSMTIIISKNDNIIEKLKENKLWVRDLEEYNE